jgi:hypothetical protein
VDGNPGLDESFMWGYHDASWENMVRGRTAATGWADFPSLTFGSATVVVRAPGFARLRVGWRGGEKQLTCELAGEAVLTGEARNGAGKPLRGFYVQLTCEGDHVSASIGPEDKGKFRIAELPAGTWSVTVRGTDGLTVLHKEEVTLGAGKTRQLKVKTKKE